MDLQNLIDIEEIRQLTYRYGWAWDSPDFELDLILSIYTDDAVYDESWLGFEPCRGIKSIEEHYRTMKPLIELGAMHAALHHMIIFQDGNNATGKSYQIGEDMTPFGYVAANGVFHDTYVRTDKGWKIKTRILKKLMPPQGLDKLLENGGESAAMKA